MAAKVTPSQIKSFWEEQSRGGAQGLFGRHSDNNITELESWYVINYGLKRWKPRSLVDVGCGLGDRTRLFSKYVRERTLGLDYSAGMIALAKKKESKHLVFQQADLLDEPSLPFAPDMVVSCRCLINLGSHRDVRKALRYFHDILPIGGKLVLCECSAQGHARLNALRKEMGLKEIQTAWHNINLDEQRIARYTNGLFEFSDLSRLGLYYVMTRVLYPALIKPKEPNPSSRINRLAAQVQKNAGIGYAEEFGRQYCMIGTKVP